MRLRYLFYAAAVVVATAGILHLAALATDPHHSESTDITTFFLVAGMAQIFWAFPTARRWGKAWHYAGIAGNVALIMLWILTRMPNPITEGGGEPITEIGIAVELLQATYIGLVGAALVRQKQVMKIDHRRVTDAA